MKKFKVTKDGFVMRTLDAEQAYALFPSATVYVLHDDDTESEVEELDEFRKYSLFGIEVGFVCDIVKELFKDEQE